MRKIYHLILIFIGCLVFTSCEKEDNAKLPDGIERINVPVIKKDANSQLSINFSNLSGFTGNFTVDTYFKDSPQPEKLEVVVVKNKVISSKKVFKSNITTYPSSFTVTAAELEALFGAPVSLADNYEFRVDLYHGGVRYEGFPSVGRQYGTAFGNFPGASLSIAYDAVCPFSIDDFVGDFEVVEDGWADYTPGATIPLTKESATSVSFKYGANEAKPIIIKFEAATGKVSVAKQVYGASYSAPDPWPYGELSCESIGTATDGFSACDKTINVTLRHTVAAGNFGEYAIILKKK